MQTQTLSGILKEPVSIKINDATLYIPAGTDIAIFIAFNTTTGQKEEREQQPELKQ